MLIVRPVIGITEVYSGNERVGFGSFPNNIISVEQAISLATPYLPLTFELRSKGREWPTKEERKPVITVVLKGDFYYLVLENYPYKSIYAYLKHAVKVNKVTGEIIMPK